MIKNVEKEKNSEKEKNYIYPKQRNTKNTKFYTHRQIEKSKKFYIHSKNKKKIINFLNIQLKRQNTITFPPKKIFHIHQKEKNLLKYSKSLIYLHGR